MDQGYDVPAAPPVPSSVPTTGDREATPVEVEFMDRTGKQRAELDEIRRRIEFMRADLAAAEKIERALVAGLEVNEPQTKPVPTGAPPF